MGDGRRILQILLPPPSAELRIRRAVGARGQSSPLPPGFDWNRSKTIYFNKFEILHAGIAISVSSIVEFPGAGCQL